MTGTRHTRTRRYLLLAALCAACLLPPRPPAVAGQDGAARDSDPSILVRWQGQTGVALYRLQVAADEGFRDVVFDGVVEGREWLVRGVSPGDYYWRVAPARQGPSAFSGARAVTVPADVPLVSVPLAPEEGAGWKTATGEVARLTAAKVRRGAVVDLVGVTTSGEAFAVDGARGASLWTSRVGGGAPAHFAPVVCEKGSGVARVLAAFSGGVRLLRGDTGLEEWRESLAGEVVGGSCADLDNDGEPELIVAARNPAALYSVSVDAGRVLAASRLGAEVIGAPVPFVSTRSRGILLTLADGSVQVRDAALAVVSALDLTERPTSPPVILGGGDEPAVAIGCEEGLVTLGLNVLRKLGHVRIGSGPVRAAPAGADVDGDGRQEIAVVTEAGRVALVGASDGVVRWSAEGAAASSEAAFADLNDDGVLDVVVPGAAEFALGFSGSDGTLLLRAEGDVSARSSARGEVPGRALRVVTLADGRTLIVGDDRGGVRAVAAPSPLRAAAGAGAFGRRGIQ